VTSPAAALVLDELIHGLSEFEPPQFSVECEVTDGNVDVVAWRYEASLKDGSRFCGTTLSGPLVLRGVTLVRDAAGSALLRWYIDWLDALNRAGLNAASRPAPYGPDTNLEHLIQLRSDQSDNPPPFNNIDVDVGKC
jgi:hypothetical protein